MGRAADITQRVRELDYKLYCEKGMDGKLCIFREGKRLETYDLDGNTLTVVRSAPHFVFALTHNWKANGKPVDWGILPILTRVRQVDLWNRDIVQELEIQEEKAEKATARDRKNKTEDFLHEFRSDFKKTFNDVNTANLSKKPKQKFKEI